MDDVEEAVDELIELLYLKGYQPKMDFFIRDAKVKEETSESKDVLEPLDGLEKIYGIRAGMFIFPNSSEDPYYLELHEGEISYRLHIIIKKEQTEIVQSSKIESVVNLRPIKDCNPAEIILKIIETMINAVDSPSKVVEAEDEEGEEEDEEGGEEGTGGW